MLNYFKNFKPINVVFTSAIFHVSLEVLILIRIFGQKKNLTTFESSHLINSLRDRQEKNIDTIIHFRYSLSSIPVTQTQLKAHLKSIVERAIA